jgi:hypothetical protein
VYTFYDVLSVPRLVQARCLENRGTDPADHSAAYVTELHRNIAELRQQVRLQEELLAHARAQATHNGGAVAAKVCNVYGAKATQSPPVNERYRETEARATQLENMLLNALVLSGAPPQRHDMK